MTVLSPNDCESLEPSRSTKKFNVEHTKITFLLQVGKDRVENGITRKEDDKRGSRSYGLKMGKEVHGLSSVLICI